MMHGGEEALEMLVDEEELAKSGLRALTSRNQGAVMAI